MAKVPKLPNRYTGNFVSDYYKKLALSENLKYGSASKDCLYKLLKNADVTKAAEIDQISGQFLKD